MHSYQFALGFILAALLAVQTGCTKCSPKTEEENPPSAAESTVDDSFVEEGLEDPEGLPPTDGGSEGETEVLED